LQSQIAGWPVRSAENRVAAVDLSNDRGRVGEHCDMQKFSSSGEG
jgi:hypothetical protein